MGQARNRRWHPPSSPPRLRYAALIALAENSRSALLATGQAGSAGGGHFGDKYLLVTAAHPRPVARKDLRSCRPLSKRSDASVWKSGAVADAVERRSRRHQRRNAVVSAESHRHSISTPANDFGGSAAAVGGARKNRPLCRSRASGKGRARFGRSIRAVAPRRICRLETHNCWFDGFQGGRRR